MTSADGFLTERGHDLVALDRHRARRVEADFRSRRYPHCSAVIGYRDGTMVVHRATDQGLTVAMANAVIDQHRAPAA